MRRALLLSSLVLLAACAQTTDFKRPVAPVPEKWRDPENGLSKVDAAKTHWRTFFPDPRLQALIETALENNRDLRIAVGRVAEARAQYGIAQADQFPAVSVGPGYGLPIGPGYSAPIMSISFELDFWGRISGMSEASRFSYLATEEARRAVHLSLIADVAGAYFEMLQMEELVVLTRTTVALREQSLDLVTKSRDLGASYDYEYQQASGILESTRASLAAMEHQRTVARNRLDFLVGSADVRLPPGRSLENQGLDAELSPGLPSEVLLMRPDVMASEQRLKAAHANIGVARAAFFPKIALTAGLGLVSSGLSTLLRASTTSISPSVSLPALFDGGRLAGGVDAAQARKVIAVAEYEKTIQQAFREVSDQMSARASWAKQVRATTANAAAQEKRLQIAEARYNAGVIGYLEVLDAQRELLGARQSSASARRAQLDAAVQLYKALGGGEQSVESTQLAQPSVR
jgi:multidrug efflux system outer membrane protein